MAFDGGSEWKTTYIPSSVPWSGKESIALSESCVLLLTDCDPANTDGWKLEYEQAPDHPDIDSL